MIMVKKPFLPYRFPSEAPRNKPAPFFNPFTLYGFGLDEGKVEMRDTDIGPWNWQWHQDIFDKIPGTASRFCEAVSRLQPNADLNFSSVLRLLRATDEVDTTIARVNSLGVSPNLYARNGYRKNCAAAVGQWQTLFACFENPPSYRHCPTAPAEYVYRDQDIRDKSGAQKSSVKVEQQICFDICDPPTKWSASPGSLAPPPVLLSSERDISSVQNPSLDSVAKQSISRVSSSSSRLSGCGNFTSESNDDCPDLSWASSLSSVSSLGESPSPELPFPGLHIALASPVSKESYNEIEGGEIMWLDGFEDFGNIFVAEALSEEEEQENDENVPPKQPANLVFVDPQLIQAPGLRPNRSPLEVLYEDGEEQPCLIENTMDKGLVPRVLSSKELSQLERLHEKSKCIDDWSWAFGDSDVDVCEEEAVGVE